jgi:aryl-alcohol dehydrogenase-like predicted oxidoreductase
MLARPIGSSSTRADTSKGTVFERKISTSEQEIVSRLEELAKRYNCKMSQVALAWMNNKIASPIVGMNSIERMEESIVSHIALKQEDIKYLEEP